MNDTDTIPNLNNINNPALVLSIGSACIVFNLVYFIVGVKVLKKNFHNLMILALLLSDAFLCVSPMFIVLSQIVPILRRNVAACIAQLFVLFYGLMLNYSFMFLICLQRYVHIRTNTVGPQLQHFERKKYQIIYGTVFATFIFQAVNCLVLPREEEIDICSAPNLYGKYLFVYNILSLVPISFLVIMLFVLYLSAGHKFWTTFLTPSLRPLQENSVVTYENKPKDYNLFSVAHNSNSKDNVFWTVSTTSMGKISENPKPFQSNKVCEDVHDQHNSDDAANGDDNAMYCDPSMIGINLDISTKTETQNQSSADLIVEDLTLDTLEDIKDNHKDEQPNLERESGYGKKEENVSSKGQRCAKELLQKWEYRVFITCVILSMQTTFCTIPAIAGFWHDVFANKPIDIRTKFFLAIPYLFNMLSNPFVYIWRIPEIRKEFKKLFKRV